MTGRIASLALSASAFAMDAGRKLAAAAHRGDVETIENAAAESVDRLMRATMDAMELAGLLNQERSAAVRDVMADYLLERVE